MGTAPLERTGLNMRLTNYWIVHVWIGAVFIVAAGGVEAAPKVADFRTILPGLGYRNDQFDDPTWSIHVARIDLARTNIGWTTVFGHGSSLGLRPMSRQIRTVPRLLGKPIAAINGDFYKTENESYPGDPRGLLICRGELISVPNANTCAWFAEDGRPHQGMVENLLHVKWADGEVDSVGCQPLVIDVARGKRFVKYTTTR